LASVVQIFFVRQGIAAGAGHALPKQPVALGTNATKSTSRRSEARWRRETM
jgi:hypothetical protein